jgi:hypothetical protein
MTLVASNRAKCLRDSSSIDGQPTEGISVGRVAIGVANSQILGLFYLLLKGPNDFRSETGFDSEDFWSLFYLIYMLF